MDSSPLQPGGSGLGGSASQEGIARGGAASDSAEPSDLDEPSAAAAGEAGDPALPIDTAAGGAGASGADPVTGAAGAAMNTGTAMGAAGAAMGDTPAAPGAAGSAGSASSAGGAGGMPPPASGGAGGGTGAPATESEPAFVVTLEQRGNGTFGVVTSDPPGFDCTRPPCTASFPRGTVVTLTARTIAQFLTGFSAWGGPCTGLEECTFSVEANTTVTAAYERANMVFVTSTSSSANLGGLAGADALCNERARFGSLTGNYIAWLSTVSGSAVDRLRGSRGWVRPDGRPVLDVPDGFNSYAMFNPIRMDELRNDVGTRSVLTATGAGGRLAPNQNTCSDFTTTMSTSVVDGGYTSALGIFFSVFVQASCAAERAIYCFGVGSNVAIRPRQEVGRVAFIGTEFPPGGGRAGADQRCGADAAALGLPGSFKAVLAGSNTSAESQFTLRDEPVVALDGVIIAATDRDFFESDRWDTTPTSFARDRYGNSGVWSGGASLSAPGTLANTCNDWTSTNGTTSNGRTGMTLLADFFHYDTGTPCTSSLSVVCLQE
jgi:hypothetical protein